MEDGWEGVWPGLEGYIAHGRDASARDGDLRSRVAALCEMTKIEAPDANAAVRSVGRLGSSAPPACGLLLSTSDRAFSRPLFSFRRSRSQHDHPRSLPAPTPPITAQGAVCPSRSAAHPPASPLSGRTGNEARGRLRCVACSPFVFQQQRLQAKGRLLQITSKMIRQTCQHASLRRSDFIGPGRHVSVSIIRHIAPLIPI